MMAGVEVHILQVTRTCLQLQVAGGPCSPLSRECRVGKPQKPQGIFLHHPTRLGAFAAPYSASPEALAPVAASGSIKSAAPRVQSTSSRNSSRAYRIS
ncbi:MAG: hypothetical protein ACYDHX_03660 [Methanothrix sp.]